MRHIKKENIHYISEALNLMTVVSYSRNM